MQHLQSEAASTSASTVLSYTFGCTQDFQVTGPPASKNTIQLMEFQWQMTIAQSLSLKPIRHIMSLATNTGEKVCFCEEAMSTEGADATLLSKGWDKCIVREGDALLGSSKRVTKQTLHCIIVNERGCTQKLAEPHNREWDVRSLIYHGPNEFANGCLDTGTVQHWSRASHKVS